MTKEPVLINVVMEVQDGNSTFYALVPLTKSFIALCIKTAESLEGLGLEMAQPAEKLQPKLELYYESRVPGKVDLLITEGEDDEPYLSLDIRKDAREVEVALNVLVRMDHGLYLDGLLGDGSTNSAYSMEGISVSNLKLIHDGMPLEEALRHVNDKSRTKRAVAKMVLEGRYS